MTLSWADRRLGAVRDEDVPVSRSAAVDAPEPTGDLPALRPADPAAARSAGAAPVTPWWIDPVTGHIWGDAPDYVHRAVKERRYCEHIRDAKAAGQTPMTAAEFFR